MRIASLTLNCTDEIRRSGRANKGHHTKNADALDEQIAKPKSKPKAEKKTQSVEKRQPTRSKSAQSEDNDDEDDAVIRCVCGNQRDIQGRQMICCDKCEVWQHNQCLDLPEGAYWDNKNYFCERCKPEDHQDLLAAMARGEKPWNRKSKKGKKPPKSRPSDVKKEKNSPPSSQRHTPAATPAPVTTQAPTPAAPPTQVQPSPAPAASAKKPSAPPAPITVPVAASHDGSNGPAKNKKDTPKSQPQSPLGEKRRHEPAGEKDGSSKKRRKSSAANPETPVSEPAVASEFDSLPPMQKPLAQKLRDTLTPLIDTAAASRSYQMPEGETSTSIATNFALEIDRFACIHHGVPSNSEAPYIKQLRSIMFNVKKNTILIDRLLSGSLTTEEFASMGADKMASEERLKEDAAMREANEKQMVLTEETGPRLRKTHKGEELVGDDDAPLHDDFRAPPRREREEAAESKPPAPPSPPRDGQAVVELPEDLGQRAPLAVDTSGTPVDGVRRTSNFDINSVFDKVRSPQADQQAFIQRRQSSIKTQEPPRQGPGDDADIDRLLKDEDQDVHMGGTDSGVVWQGGLQMQQMEPIEITARFVAGGDFGQVVPWNKLLPSLLPIKGRIENQKGDDYIRSLAITGSHDVCVLAITPTTAGGLESMEAVYNYFHPRQRWGVIPVPAGENEIVRDLYVVPLEPGPSSLPPFLDMLEYCVIETPRKEPMMLLALVAKLPENKPAADANPFESGAVQSTPSGQAPQPGQLFNGAPNGASPSPLPNPHGPQYSPMAPSFPAFDNGNTPSHNNNFPQAPPPHNNGYVHTQPGAQMAQALSPTPPAPFSPLAIKYLGEYLQAPVIAKILASSEGGANMTEEQMANLRHIMETVPRAQSDFNVFQEHLATSFKPV
ncbi:SPOC-domain-containing protein [Periconia macrospinosa]|uniref:Transcription factor BYE1 n=1 Tax=Periconia macrospinosa TaxID=97972 RepID=A0A2V1DC14_9PLEO|nr:SPOC-domain-containing protein [Periconia macrospinosa]